MHALLQAQMHFSRMNKINKYMPHWTPSNLPIYSALTHFHGEWHKKAADRHSTCIERADIVTCNSRNYSSRTLDIDWSNTTTMSAHKCIISLETSGCPCLYYYLYVAVLPAVIVWLQHYVNIIKLISCLHLWVVLTMVSQNDLSCIL